MAKGVEDTAFYVYTRFVSSNEVGSSIKIFGISQERFHEANRKRLKESPDAMLATSTHDTKRSEDVRNRLNVLSELTYQWPSYVRRWQRMNAKYKRTLDDGRVAPNASEEYLIYQTIIGAWPWSMQSDEERSSFLGRMQEYMTKALSEAKVNLSWTSPNQAYVDAVNEFLKSILMPDGKGREPQFTQTLRELIPAVEIFGAVNSLAQLVLKVASPGVPDFYQGTEMWELNLVDPDNRRPVDYGLRRQALDDMLAQAMKSGPLSVCRDVLRTLSDGRIKLWTTHGSLAARNRMPEVFQRGEYVPVTVTNGHKEHVLAFSRGGKAIAVVPRFAHTMMGGKTQLPLKDAWGDSELLLPDLKDVVLENIFSGELMRVGANGRLEMRRVFAEFPVALLVACS
jgi:(1->4)-alpha-D-glucan 1-alpha-D-glucosylmutase